MTDKLYLITAQKIAELIANAKDYNAEKIAMLLQSLPMVDSAPVTIDTEPVVYRCADCKTPLMPGYDCGSCGSFAAEEIEETPHTSPQALKQISADDVTDEMIKYFTDQFKCGSVNCNEDEIVAAYNAVIKHRSFLK